MKKLSLVLAMVLGVFMMLTLCYSVQAQNLLKLSCTANGWNLGGANYYEIDISKATVTFNMYGRMVTADVNISDSQFKWTFNDRNITIDEYIINRYTSNFSLTRTLTPNYQPLVHHFNGSCNSVTKQY